MDKTAPAGTVTAKIFHKLHRACHGELLGVDFFDPCPAGCLHCRHGQGHTKPVRPISTDLPNLVVRELERRRRRGSLPAFIVLGANSEPFPASAIGQKTTLTVLERILERKVGISIETRGVIPDETIELLARHRTLVRVRVAIFAADRHMLGIWEPGTADLDTRLFNLQRLREATVPTVCHIGPIIPTVNDRRQRIEEIFATAADVGIRRVTSEVLHILPGHQNILTEQLPGRAEVILSHYLDHTTYPPRHRSLPDPEYRTRLYDMLRELAFKYHLQFGLCRCADKELGTPPCNLGFGTARRATRQLGLFAPSAVPQSPRPQPRSGPTLDPTLRRPPGRNRND